MRWPFVLRSTYERLEEDYFDLAEQKQHLIAEAAALRNLLANASKNDHRDPVTGQFIKAPK